MSFDFKDHQMLKSILQVLVEIDRKLGILVEREKEDETPSLRTLSDPG